MCQGLITPLALLSMWQDPVIRQLRDCKEMCKLISRHVIFGCKDLQRKSVQAAQKKQATVVYLLRSNSEAVRLLRLQ